MKKINLLPLLFSLSFSVAWGAQTQESNEQDKAKENIELKNNKEPFIPSLKRDISRHWGYYIILTIHDACMMRILLPFMTFFFNFPIGFNRHFLKYFLSITLLHFIIAFILSISIASIEETSKVDDNPNPLSDKNCVFRILKFMLLPGILNGFISLFAALYYLKEGSLKFDLTGMESDQIAAQLEKNELTINFITFFYPLLLKAVCIVPYWLITPTIENTQTQEANEQDKATVDKTNYIV